MNLLLVDMKLKLLYSWSAGVRWDSKRDSPMIWQETLPARVRVHVFNQCVIVVDVTVRSAVR